MHRLDFAPGVIAGKRDLPYLTTIVCHRESNSSTPETSPMGSEAYYYFVEYDADPQAALERLREREFRAGRYNPVMPFPIKCMPADDSSPAPGNQHQSIEEALEEAEADGTRSILDIMQVADEPDFCTATPVADDQLQSLYGTTEPTRDQIEGLEFLEEVDRGQGVYLTYYTPDGKPAGLCFAGMSFD